MPNPMGTSSSGPGGRAFSGITGGVGALGNQGGFLDQASEQRNNMYRRIFGKSGYEKAQEALNNEYRGVGGMDQFAAGGAGQRDAMGRQVFGQNVGALSGYNPQMQQLMGGLQATAEGHGSGQSLADRAAGMQVSQLQSQMAGSRGPQAAAAARQFGANQGGIAQTAVQGRLQAQQAAAQQMGALGTQMRGQDIQGTLQSQQMGMQNNMQNAQMYQQALLARQQQMGDRFGAIAGQAGALSGAGNTEAGAMGGLSKVLGAFS